jgi:hypothetical protein
LGITRLAIRGDSQLTAGQAGEANMSTLMEAYAGKVRIIECCFNDLKLEHVPSGKTAIVKELS